MTGLRAPGGPAPLRPLGRVDPAFLRSGPSSSPVIAGGGRVPPPPALGSTDLHRGVRAGRHPGIVWPPPPRFAAEESEAQTTSGGASGSVRGWARRPPAGSGLADISAPPCWGVGGTHVCSEVCEPVLVRRQGPSVPLPWQVPDRLPEDRGGGREKVRVGPERW